MAEAASEAEDGCVPGGAVVDREVGSGGVRHHIHIVLFWKSGGDAVICFCMLAQNKGTAYFAVGGGVLCRWQRTLSVAELEAKREVGANCEEV